MDNNHHTSKSQRFDMDLNIPLTTTTTAPMGPVTTPTSSSPSKSKMPARKMSHGAKLKLQASQKFSETRKHHHQLQHQQSHQHQQLMHHSQNLTNDQHRRRKIRRSMSFDTVPKMKNKVTICQPIVVQRRITISAGSTVGVKLRGKKQHLVLVCLAMISFTAFLAMSIIAPFFPKESSKKGMRESVNGLVFSAYPFVMMLFSPVVSIIIPVLGQKRTLIIGVIISGLANILFGFLINIESLGWFTASCFLVRTFEALGGAAFSTATYTIVLVEFGDNVGTAFSIVETSIGLGMSLGPAIGGFLYGIGGYALPFYALGGLILMTIPFCVFVIDDNKECQMISSAPGSYWKLFSIYKIILNAFIIIISSQLFSFLDPTIEPHLRKINLDPHHVSLVFLMMSATYCLSSPIIGYISSVSKRKFLIMAFGLLFLAIEFIFLGPADFLGVETSFTQAAVCMAFIGVSYSIAFIPTFENFLHLAVDNGFPDDVGTYSLVSGIWSSFVSFGEILGPVFGGILSENIGFKSSSVIMGVSSLVMALICFCSCIFDKDIDRDVEKNGYKPIMSLEEKKERLKKTSINNGYNKKAHRRKVDERTALLV